MIYSPMWRLALASPVLLCWNDNIFNTVNTSAIVKLTLQNQTLWKKFLMYMLESFFSKISYPISVVSYFWFPISLFIFRLLQRLRLNIPIWCFWMKVRNGRHQKEHINTHWLNMATVEKFTSSIWSTRGKC